MTRIFCGWACTFEIQILGILELSRKLGKVFNKLFMVAHVSDAVSILCCGEGALTIDEDGCLWYHGTIFPFKGILEKVDTALYRLNLPNVQITTMSTSKDHWVGIDSCGKAWGFGKNFYHELGVNSSRYVLSAVNIPICEEVISVTCGYRRTLFISKSGKVYGCGSNAGNCLGIPHGLLFNKNIIQTPTVVPKLNNIVQIACNSDNSIFLRENGDLIVSGTVIKDRILYQKCFVVARKSSITNVKNIVCGTTHVMIQTIDDDIIFRPNTYILYEHTPISIDITSEIQNIYSNYNSIILESNNSLWVTTYHGTACSELFTDGFKVENNDELVQIESPPGDILDCIIGCKSVIALTTEGIYQFGASISSQHSAEDRIFQWNSITEEKKKYFDLSKYFRNRAKSAKTNININ